MSSSPATPTPSTGTLGKITVALQAAGGYVGLVGQLIPLLIAGGEEIKAIFQTGQTIDFEVELTAEQAALLNAYATDEGDGAIINAELARQGQPTLVFPAAEATTQIPSATGTSTGPQPAGGQDPPASPDAPAQSVTNGTSGDAPAQSTTGGSS